MMSMLRIGFALIVICWLAACAPTLPKPPVDAPVEGTSGPYAIDQDGAPLRTIAPEDVADAVPRPDPILSAGNVSPYQINGISYDVIDDATDYREQGTASWYGVKFHGHKTSNGEIYDLYQATAAHKTLPIPSYARVTNLDNGRSVVVRVNDRGPFYADRVIDLSYGAAVKLGYMATGTARVEVDFIAVVGVDDRRGAIGGDYRFLQVGAFGAESSALQMQSELSAALSAPVFVSEVQTGEQLMYRVRVGPMDDGQQLVDTQKLLEQLGYQPGQPLP